jgi:Holliday junction resolvasome RuvABC endonuclease subunit
LRILALDQARNGGWSVFEYPQSKPIEYGSFEYSTREYTYPQAVLEIEKLVESLIKQYKISAVFLEDIQLRFNVQAFKKLAQLQGVLINYMEKNNMLYGLIAPSQWQSYCEARGRTTKELKDDVRTLRKQGKKNSKILSIEFVKQQFHIDTTNDNIADAICIGYYACEKVVINTGKNKED